MSTSPGSRRAGGNAGGSFLPRPHHLLLGDGGVLLRVSPPGQRREFFLVRGDVSRFERGSLFLIPRPSPPLRAAAHRPHEHDGDAVDADEGAERGAEAAVRGGGPVLRLRHRPRRERDHGRRELGLPGAARVAGTLAAAAAAGSAVVAGSAAVAAVGCRLGVVVRGGGRHGLDVDHRGGRLGGVRRVGVRRCLLLNLGRLVRALRDLVAGDGARRGEPDGDAAANERRRAEGDASAPAGAEGAEASDRDGPPTGRGRRSRDGSGKETRGPNLGAKERRRGHGRVRARRCGPRVRREASASTLTREMSGRADPCVPGARGSGSTGRRLDWGHCVASFFFARE